jgi:hypothetical protein
MWGKPTAVSRLVDESNDRLRASLASMQAANAEPINHQNGA